MTHLERNSGTPPKIRGRLGVKAFFAIALTILIVVVALVLAPIDAPAGKTDASVNQRRNGVNFVNQAGQLVVDGAIAASILSLFDDTARKRRRAQGQTIKELKAIRLAAEKAVAQRSVRAAETMVSLPFAGKLVWESGADFFDDHNRHWTLFDHALAATEETLDETDSAFARQRSKHGRQLQQDQSRYWEAMKSHDVAAPPKDARLEARSKFLQADVKPRIMKQVGSRIRSRFPKVIQKASVKLGKKQALKAPAAALDGPFPFVETALLIWGLYDIGVGTAELRSDAQNEIATTIARESNAIVLEADNRTAKQVIRAEDLAQLQRCKGLDKALSRLLFPAKEAELAQRCNKQLKR